MELYLPTSRPECQTTDQSEVRRSPLDVTPEFGDLIPDLRARGVHIQLIPALPHGWLYPCGGCTTSDFATTGDPVTIVCHVAPSEALPEGYTYREEACAACLWQMVVWQLRRGCRTWLEVPA